MRNVAQTHLKDVPKDGLSGNKIISQQEIEVQFSTNQLVFYGDKDIFFSSFSGDWTNFSKQFIVLIVLIP